MREGQRVDLSIDIVESGGVAVASLLSLTVFSLVRACASDQPKGPPQPTPDQVRSHADRAFEKLKQEEQERAVSRRCHISEPGTLPIRFG